MPEGVPSSLELGTGGRETAATDWNGLPAPWQPLPEWMSAPPSPRSPLPTSPDAAVQGNGTWSGPTAANEQNDVPARGADSSGAQSNANPGTDTASAPLSVPDDELDRLAKRVYSLLKRRLAVEYRREK